MGGGRGRHHHCHRRSQRRRCSHNAYAKCPLFFSAVPEETPVDQERGTCDSCCQPPSPDNVPLPDELEEDPNDGTEPPAEPPTEPTIGLKELTDQIQAVMQRLDERAQAAAKPLLEKAQELSKINAKNQEEPTSFSSQLTPTIAITNCRKQYQGNAFACSTCAVGKNGSTLAGTSVLSPFLHIGSVIALAAMICMKSTVQLFERHPCLYILTFSFVAAKITNQLVVAHMTKRPSQYATFIAIFNANSNQETVGSVASKLRNYESMISGPMQAQVSAVVKELRDKIREKDPKGLRWAFGIAAVEAEVIKKLISLPRLSENPSAVGLLKVEEQRVPVATSMVHRRQCRTNQGAMIPIHKMIRELESQGVVSKTHSPFNSPIWPVCKSDREWRLTVDYRALSEVTTPLSAAVPDMLELQYELESKAAKWYATIDIANAFFSIPLAAECRPQFAFTWRGVQYTWNRLPQG
ncbi:hypothetical protein DUI87_19140 [Hirundo rustica rustica]|uniref:ribonuclease H n=1 Tax=Hirundo rustica rustica TaxID=333673 RepID=A0A3M0JVV2_HIRRU|nr:hypothetical protein DUI87_19140 [Hirundo rustica rustica]